MLESQCNAADSVWSRPAITAMSFSVWDIRSFVLASIQKTPQKLDARVSTFPFSAYVGCRHQPIAIVFSKLTAELGFAGTTQAVDHEAPLLGSHRLGRPQEIFPQLLKLIFSSGVDATH